MGKFKKGDRVRRITCNVNINVGTECIVEDVDGLGWLKLKGYNYGFGNDPFYFELVSPSGFEVGKRYQHLKVNTIYEVLYLGKDIAFVRRNDGIECMLQLDQFDKYIEYIPPPPEEWRAVFYVKNGKPEISAAYNSSKEDVEYTWRNNSTFMYAIRTDEGVLKNGN